MQLVVSRAIQTVPYPLLGENTLVLSDSMVLARDEKGDLALMFRLDTASEIHPTAMSFRRIDLRRNVLGASSGPTRASKILLIRNLLERFEALSLVAGWETHTLPST